MSNFELQFSIKRISIITYHVSREFITNSWLLFFFLQIFFNIITQYSLFSRNQLVLEMRNFFLLSSINNDRILYCYMEFEKKISRIYNFENRKLEMYTGLIFTSAFITYISVNDESTDPYSIRVLSGWPFFPSAFKPSNIHRTKSRCGTRKFLTTPRPWHRFIQAALFTTTDTRRIPHISLLFHIWNVYRRSLLRVTNETIHSEQIKLLKTFNFLWAEIRQDPFILENKILFESFLF